MKPDQPLVCTKKLPGTAAALQGFPPRRENRPIMVRDFCPARPALVESPVSPDAFSARVQAPVLYQSSSCTGKE